MAAESIPEIAQSSVISLNFANARGENQIKARTFEVPGAGGFLLTENAEGLDHFYAVGKEIAVFDDGSDLEQKIRYYLAHAPERDAIANAGFERTSRNHTYETRLSELLTFALAAKENWLEQRPAIHFPPLADCYRTHRRGFGLRILRSMLMQAGRLIWGPNRGPRAARRFVFELSWRLLGAQTFTARGLPGRMFPEL